MKMISGDGSYPGVVDTGTMLKQQAEADALRAGTNANLINHLVTPNAQQVSMKDVTDDRTGTIWITDCHARFADGTVVLAPSIVIERT